MEPRFTIDSREFSKALREYKDVSKSSLVEIIIRRTLFILRRALARTPLATRAAVEQAVNLVGTKLRRDKKTGLLKKGANVYGTVRWLEGRIVKKWQKEGRSFTHADVVKEARKGLGRRLSAIGSLRAGWSKPLRKFLAAAGVNLVDMKLPRVKHPGDYAMPKKGSNPEAMIEYDLVTSRLGSKTKDIDPRVVDALQGAVDAEVEEMKAETARRLQEAANKFNAR
jgi:hypothetical protein